jgi:hypothetical protein
MPPDETITGNHLHDLYENWFLDYASIYGALVNMG